MHDIKFIKKEPKKFDDFLKKRNLPPTSKKLIEIHDSYLKFLNLKETLQQKRNKLSTSIGKLSKDSEKNDIESIKRQVVKIKNDIQDVENLSNKKMQELHEILENIPNILDEKVPYGKNDKSNKVLRIGGEIEKKDFNPVDHVALGEKLNLINYRQASNISGSRFSVLSSELALLNRALINFMLDKHTLKNGYVEYLVPELVKSKALFGTGQLPKFKADLFQTSNDLWLIPTGEVSLTNL